MFLCDHVTLKSGITACFDRHIYRSSQGEHWLLMHFSVLGDLTENLNRMENHLLML